MDTRNANVPGRLLSGLSGGFDVMLDGLRVLLAEDNPTNQMVATQMLESLGASAVFFQERLRHKVGVIYKEGRYLSRAARSFLEELQAYTRNQ